MKTVIFEKEIKKELYNFLFDRIDYCFLTHSVLEYTPIKRSYQFRDKYYFLQFPWTYIVISKKGKQNINRLGIYGSLRKIQSPQDPLFVLPLAHQSQSGMCLGEGVPIEEIDNFIFSNNKYYTIRYPSIKETSWNTSHNLLIQWRDQGIESIPDLIYTNLFNVLSGRVPTSEIVLDEK